MSDVTPVTLTMGTIAALVSIPCWIIFWSGAFRMTRIIALGQADGTRMFPLLPRVKQVFVEVAAHTRMNKFRTVGWAHWLVMVGFLIGATAWLEAYGETFNPHFHWPIVGNLPPWSLLMELLGWGTVIGIIVLIVIRQRNHPRSPERMSRFAGSNFGQAYFVEAVVLIEGLGVVMVRASKYAVYGGGEYGHITYFGTRWVAELLPASPTLVSVFAMIKLFSGMIWLLIVGRNITMGVAWHRFSAFFNIYFKREDDGAVALGAAKPMMSGGKVLNLEEADPEVDAFGAGQIEDFSWKGWLDFTTCTECGRCQSQCPAWNTGKPLSPKLLILSLRDHAYAKAPYLLAGGKKDMAGEEIGLVDKDGNVREDALAKIPEAARLEAERKLVGAITGAVNDGIIDPEVLWSCTTCGACVEQCPVDIEHVDHIIDMRRYQVLIESEFPHELAGLFKNLENKGNPWGQNAKDRLNWMNEVDFEVPVFEGDFADSEYLFWVGCAGAYEDRAKKTTKAVAELLHIAGVKFMVLGMGETCTGDSARRAGNELLFQTLAQQNIAAIDEVFEGKGSKARKVVVTCPHCYNAIGNEYPQLGGDYQVVHHTQLLNRLVRDKRLIPVSAVSEDVTYHDPCYLGRHNKIYEAPRDLIAASGAKLNEMPRHGERSLCCGAGGARMWMEEQIGKRVNLERTDEALATNPKKVATGCPFCRVMLTDGVTARAETGAGAGVEVVDVAQMLLESVRNGIPEGVKLGSKRSPSLVAAAAPAAAPKAPAAPVATAPTKAAPAKAAPAKATPAPGAPTKKSAGGMAAPAKKAAAGGMAAPAKKAAAPAAEASAPSSGIAAPAKKAAGGMAAPAKKAAGGMAAPAKKAAAPAAATPAPAAAPAEAPTPSGGISAPAKKAAGTIGAPAKKAAGGIAAPATKAAAPAAAAPAPAAPAESAATPAPAAPAESAAAAPVAAPSAGISAPVKRAGTIGAPAKKAAAPAKAAPKAAPAPEAPVEQAPAEPETAAPAVEETAAPAAAETAAPAPSAASAPAPRSSGIGAPAKRTAAPLKKPE